MNGFAEDSTAACNDGSGAGGGGGHLIGTPPGCTTSASAPFSTLTGRDYCNGRKMLVIGIMMLSCSAVVVFHSAGK